MVSRFALISPVIAIRQMSMAAAATDLRAHLRFMDQAEQHRYRLVQQLNQMQADAVSYADDTASDPGADQRKRVDRSQWQAIPAFGYVPLPPWHVLQSLSWPLLGLLGWVAVGAALISLSVRRLGGAR